MNYLFDKNWFQRHQKGLLWLLNAPIIKYWFRWVLLINKDCSFQEKICEIQPNNYKVDLGLRWTKNHGIERHIRADFRTHNKFSKRLYYAFYPIWWLAHQWDMLVANPFRPTWNLGFDTLTAYPNSGTTNPWDARLYTENLSGNTIAQVASASGSNVFASGENEDRAWHLRGDGNSNKFDQASRSYYGFDISSISSGTISGVVFSLYQNSGVSQNGMLGSAANGSKCVVVDATPGGSSPAASDYQLLGSTEFVRSPTQASFSAIAYEDMTLDSNGIALAQSHASGNVFYGVRSAWEFDGNITGLTWGDGNSQSLFVYQADNTGTTNDPKLVVTYTATTDYPLTAALGTFTFTGVASALFSARAMIAALGTFTYTGLASTLTSARNIVAAVGTFTLTGVSATLTSTRSMVAAVGTFTLTGIDAAFSFGYHLVTEVGTYTYTLIDVAVYSARHLALEVGEFVLTGVDATLTSARGMIAETGSFVLSFIFSYFKIWDFQDKNTSNWTNKTKDTSIWTNKDKHEI